MTRNPMPQIARPGARLTARLSPGVAIALFVTTGVLWFLTTRPAEGLQELQPQTRLSIDRWAVVFSTIFGAIVLTAGLIGIAILGFTLWMERIRRENEEHRVSLVEVRAQATSLRQEIATLQRHIESLNTWERQLRSGESRDPDEVAGLLYREKQNLDGVISRLRAVEAEQR